MRGLLNFLATVALYSGLPFVMAINLLKLKRFGDGTGNESGMAEGFQWAMVIGIVLWVSLLTAFTMWLCLHLLTR